MRHLLLFAFAGLLCFHTDSAQAQTADEVSKLIDRLIQLDSIDLAKDVKFRAGLEPSLFDLDADESKMTVLKYPYEVHGRDKPGAAGWYRVSFVVPEKLGKFAIPKGGYNLGIESNVTGSWEIYTYVNGKRAGLWSKDGMYTFTNLPPTAWMSNAPMPTKAGDKITVAILATASPLGRGSPRRFRLESSALALCPVPHRRPPTVLRQRPRRHRSPRRPRKATHEARRRIQGAARKAARPAVSPGCGFPGRRDGETWRTDQCHDEGEQGDRWGVEEVRGREGGRYASITGGWVFARPASVARPGSGARHCRGSISPAPPAEAWRPRGAANPSHSRRAPPD
jgi:hypothetical protein